MTDYFSKIEMERGIILPQVYKEFFYSCSYSTPQSMIGSDLFNDKPLLNEWASELIEECQINNFLDKEDFVFMMHQGYMFWYFRADGSNDPDVYFYQELRKEPVKLCSFTKFINNYPESSKTID